MLYHNNNLKIIFSNDILQIKQPTFSHTSFNESVKDRDAKKPNQFKGNNFIY